MSPDIFPCLLEVEKIYSKQFPAVKFETTVDEKRNYKPYSQTINFKRPEYLGNRFININVYDDGSSICEKFGKYELQVYLYPIGICYGEPTPNANPTISIYLKELPTAEYILKFIDNKIPTQLKDFKKQV